MSQGTIGAVSRAVVVRLVCAYDYETDVARAFAGGESPACVQAGGLWIIALSTRRPSEAGRSAVLVDVVVRATTISLELRPPQYGSVLLDDVALRLRIGYIYKYRRFDRCICFDIVL